MMADLYFWRQLFVLVAITFYGIGVGLMVAFPSVLTPALLAANNTDISATAEEASWIVTSNGFAGALGFFVLSPVLQVYGRKAAHIVANLFLFIGWIIFPFARNTAALFVARIIQGGSMGAIYICSMVISEYTIPERRGYFTTIKNIFLSFGTLLCHVFSLFWNWRQIALFGIAISTMGMVLTLFWPESPSYLAMKGRVKDCEKSYLWLYGGSKMKELDALISSQRQKLRNPPKEKWYKSLFRSDFLKPFIIVTLLTLLLDLCGKYYFVVFVIQIMIELVGDKSLATYCSVGADVLIIAALITSCYVICIFKRRSLLLCFGVSAVALMFFISLVIVLKLSSVTWFTPALILLLCFLVNVGIIPVCYTVIGEVFPLEHKGSGSCTTGVVFTLLYALMLKVTPMLLDHTGVEGVYAVYGFCIIFCLVGLYFIVPETKDRSLQEIESEFKRNVKKCDDNIYLKINKN